MRHPHATRAALNVAITVGAVRHLQATRVRLGEASICLYLFTTDLDLSRQISVKRIAEKCAEQ